MTEAQEVAEAMLPTTAPGLKWDDPEEARLVVRRRMSLDESEVVIDAVAEELLALWREKYGPPVTLTNPLQGAW